MITETVSAHRRGFDPAAVVQTDRDHEREYLERLESFIYEQVARFEPEIREYVEGCLSTGGKRIRPKLLYRASFSGESEISTDLVKAGGVVELVHVATLIHDDVLDESILRHSSSTLFSDQGPSVAVLVGDALFSHALKLASEFPTTEVCSWVSEATRRTCSGEIQQTFHRGKLNLSLDDYYRVIELKTAELFRVSCLVGAFLGGFNETFRAAAATFGLRLGVAYQLYDDLADIFGEELRLGKTLGTDWNNRKPTLPLILLLRDIDPGLAENLWQSSEAGVDEIRRMVSEHELFESCIERVKNELSSAKTALSTFSSLGPVPLLFEAIQYMENRLIDLHS